MPGRSLPPFGAPLSDQEVVVLRHVADGRSNPAIGELLYVSEDTVKTYVSRVFAKLGVSSRIGAVMAGIRMGVVECPCRKAVAS